MKFPFICNKRSEIAELKCSSGRVLLGIKPCQPHCSGCKVKGLYHCATTLSICNEHSQSVFSEKYALVCGVSFIGRRTTNSCYAMRENVHQSIEKITVNVWFIGKGTFTLVVV